MSETFVELYDVNVTVDQVVDQVDVEQVTQIVTVESAFVAPSGGGSVYTEMIDQDSSTTCYVGEAAPGSSQTEAVWRIRRKAELPGGITSVLWAENETGFSHSWADRTEYTYG